MPGKRFTLLNNHYFLGGKTTQMFPLTCRISSEAGIIQAGSGMLHMVLSDRGFSRLSSNTASPPAQHRRNTQQGAQNNTCRDRCQWGVRWGEYSPLSQRTSLGTRDGIYMGQQVEPVSCPQPKFSHGNLLSPVRCFLLVQSYSALVHLQSSLSPQMYLHQLKQIKLSTKRGA